MNKEEYFKLTGGEFQKELLLRMEYKEEFSRCNNCKYFHYNVEKCSECGLIPLMRLKVDDNGCCNYYQKK